MNTNTVNQLVINYVYNNIYIERSTTRHWSKHTSHNIVPSFRQIILKTIAGYDLFKRSLHEEDQMSRYFIEKKSMGPRTTYDTASRVPWKPNHWDDRRPRLNRTVQFRTKNGFRDFGLNRPSSCTNPKRAISVKSVTRVPMWECIRFYAWHTRESRDAKTFLENTSSKHSGVPEQLIVRKRRPRDENEAFYGIIHIANNNNNNNITYWNIGRIIKQPSTRWFIYFVNAKVERVLLLLPDDDNNNRNADGYNMKYYGI